MEGWWYLCDGVRIGPVDIKAMQALYRDGVIDPATDVWQEGMARWMPLHDVPALQEAMHAVPPPSPVTGDSAERLAQPLAGRWARFFARMFDLGWESLVASLATGLLIGRFSPEFVHWINRPYSGELFFLLCLPLALVLDAVLFAAVGTTPGKAALGLQVTSNRGQFLSFGAYLRRNVRLWIDALGIGILPLSVFTLARQSGRLHKGRQTTYDEAYGIHVHAKPLGLVRSAAFGLAFCMLAALLGTLRVMEAERDRQRIEAGASKIFIWTNPETDENVVIDARWKFESQVNDYGTTLFVFSELTDHAQTIFGPETAPGISLPEYADAFMHNMEGRMQFQNRGHFYEKDDLPVWEVKGTLRTKKNSVLSVRIVQLEDVFWRSITVMQPPLEFSSEISTILEKALWESVLPREPRPMT